MALEFDGANPENTRAALTVSALNRAVSGLLQRSFPLVRVRGEIANVTRAASGHWYFALKDDQAQARCVMFRARNQLLGWMPQEGDEVEVSAVVSLYEARGEFQLSVESMRRAGQGRLFEEFLRLKARLAAEGLFAGERKRALPRIPRRVAVVTSMQAAALGDVITALGRRASYVGIVIYPVPVQGAGAGAQIAAMLRKVSRRAALDAIDVVLLVRGGGSIEDLWAFNEEVGCARDRDVRGTGRRRRRARKRHHDCRLCRRSSRANAYRRGRTGRTSGSGSTRQRRSAAGCACACSASACLKDFTSVSTMCCG